ncbi:hypothetical protein [Pseudooceanicola spongiae]|uniref:Uncharacterized protein n=1 Tax=Pseudooceanicola spongiae TaxID=2613965 RepID=A0A7L9WJ75_9RHOB|nr:hypothetical protein [Pseudooceanicola spongiae]QOL80441.1 hypothetical protein F3W81_06210 [Pseudooceanicola spongiae]
MRKIIFLALLAGSVSSAVAAERLHELSVEEQDRLESSVRSSLKDPESAKFSRITAIKGEAELITACGQVNAKNSLGGYAGDMPFAVFLMSPDDVAMLGDTGMMQETVEKICSSVHDVMP